jgi:WD40 repeat protein
MTRVVFASAVAALLAAVAHRTPSPNAGAAGGRPTPAAQVGGKPDQKEPPPPPAGLLARYGDTRLRLTGQVHSVALRPDGRAVAAAATGSGTVIEWDAGTGQELRRYADPGKPAREAGILGYTPDGRRLITTADYNRVVVYATETGNSVARFDVSGGHVSNLAIGPGGKTVAGRHPDRRLTIWDTESGQPVRQFMAYPGERICFSPDGKQIAACLSKEVVWFGPTDGSGPGREIAVPGGEQNGLWKVVWPRADRLVALGHGGLTTYDPATVRQVARDFRPYQRPVRDLLVGPDGRLYADLGKPDAVEFDPDTLRPVAAGRVLKDQGAVHVRASECGTIRAVADGNAVRLHDARAGQPLVPDADRNPAWPWYTLRFAAGGRRLLTDNTQVARVWETAGGRVAPVAEWNSESLHERHLSPDGQWVAGVVSSQSVMRLVIRAAATGAEAFRESGPPAGRLEATSPVGFDPAGRLWVLEMGTGELRQVELPSGRVLRTLPGFEQTVYVALSPDGKRVAVGGWKAFAVRDTAPGAEWKVIETYPGRQPGGCGLALPPCPAPLAFTPDGRELFTVRGRSVLVWDVSSPRPGTTRRRDGVTGERESLFSPAFSPDGRRVAILVGNWKSATLRVWETATLAEVARIDAPQGLTGYALTPDGRRLVAAHPDTTLSVWDTDAVEAAAIAGPLAGPPWDQLASPDPVAGLRAVRHLAARPADAVALLRDRYRTVPADRIAALVAELDAPAFADREKAQKELASLGEAAEGAVRRAAAESTSAEVRQRAGELLKPLAPADGRLSAAHRRAVRAVEALERAGTPEARGLLDAWAAGDPGTLRAAEAAAAVARRKGRPR